ncbi:MAG: hypothetical protein K2X00_21140 [Nitrospiraceae bacterium]|nr:hypothetical protein [Nitrospiraceae bacterium]
MSANLCLRDFFLSSSSRKIGLGLVLFLVLSACSEGAKVDSCIYLDAFEKEVMLEEFSRSKGHADALKLISQGRIVFLGGYLENGPITYLLTRGGTEYPGQEVSEIVKNFGLDRIEKVYITKNLNQMKMDDFLKSDDGVVDGIQIEMECYNSTVQSYAVEFNETMVRELLKKT